MNLKSLFNGTTATLIAASGTIACAQAADTAVVPEPKDIESVRICDAYGAGYVYIPGTETCFRISGYVRADISAGDDVFTGKKLGTWSTNTRFTLNTQTATETELGTLKTFTENRFEYGDGRNKTNQLKYAYIELNGLRVGKDESAFHTFTGYLGDINNDDVVSPGAYDTNLLSYRYDAGNGYSAILSAEQGGEDSVYRTRNIASLPVGTSLSNNINTYMPHLVGGLKLAQGWGSLAGVVAYDSLLEKWTSKVRLDVKLTDAFSVWVQGGYASYENDDGMYGNWGGNWAVWGGAQYKATEKAAINLQAAHEDWGKTALAANVAYVLIPGLTITPEMNYTAWKQDHPSRIITGEKDAFGGMVRFQRAF